MAGAAAFNCNLQKWFSDNGITDVSQLNGKTYAKKIEDVKIVISGAGAAGLSICKLLLKFGFQDITMCDIAGTVYKGRKENNLPYDR